MAKRRIVTVGHALKEQAAEAAKVKYPANKKPGKREKTTVSIAEAKATGAPIRSGKPKKPRVAVGYSPIV